MSQVTFENTPCNPQSARDELKNQLPWRVPATASREEVALGLVRMGKELIPKDYACAEGSFLAAIQLYPKLAVAHNNLGVVKYKKEKYRNAIDSFKEALRLNPGYGEANSNLGIALEANGSKLDAVQVYGKKQPNNAFPSHRELSLALGIPTLSTSDSREVSTAVEAVMQYRLALKNHPNSALLHYNLAVALDAGGNLDAAIAEYQATIQFKPDFAEAYGNLANAYAIKGERAYAYHHFEKARVLFRLQKHFYDVQKIEQLMQHFQLL